MFYQIVTKLSARLSLQRAVLDIHKTERKEIPLTVIIVITIRFYCTKFLNALLPHPSSHC